jgi:ATP adenylyltransferase
LKKKSVAKKSSVSKGKKSKTGGKNTLQLGQNIWPCERDILFRPDRYKYVRKLIKPSGCVFCHSSQEPMSFDTLCVYKSKFSMIVMNKFPYNSGHVLALPLGHGGDLLELSQEESLDLQNTVLLAMRAIKDIYQPAGFNLGLNQGAVSGAGIPDHLHYHVIPRWAGDLNFFPLVAETKVVIESLEVSFNRLVKYLKEYES